MKILVTGASGLVGSNLSRRLWQAGHEVIELRRHSGTATPQPTWHVEAGRIDLAPAGPLDAVVHLAGENIAQRWTPEAMARIRDSRVEGTRLLSEALAGFAQPPRVLVCASATGFYGDRGEEVLDEHSARGRGFLADVCRDWEAATAPASRRGLRVATVRLGVVLASQGGALAKMLPTFRLGLGGPLGSGRQYWSWITLDDLLEVFVRLVEDATLSGAFNAVAPHTVTNREFTAALARALGRPAVLPVPAFALRMMMGGMADEALLASARVKPARLVEAGFRFQFPELGAALHHLLRKGGEAASS